MSSVLSVPWGVTQLGERAVPNHMGDSPAKEDGQKQPAWAPDPLHWHQEKRMGCQMAACPGETGKEKALQVR